MLAFTSLEKPHALLQRCQVDLDEFIKSINIKIGSWAEDKKMGEIITTNISRGNLLLFHQNYAMLDIVPQNVFSALPIGEIKETILLKQNADSINITARKGDVGEVYIAGLSPQPSSIYKIKCAYKTDNKDSVGYFKVSNILVGIQQNNDGKGKIIGYYKGSTGIDRKKLVVNSGVDSPFELTIICDAVNKSALIRFNDDETLSLEVPYWDSSIRDLPYAVLNPQYIKVYHWLSSNSMYSSLDIFEISQETNRQLITVIAPNNLQPFGLDGPHPFNTIYKGNKYMSDNGFNGTLWLDVGSDWTKNEIYRSYLQDLVKNKGWEVGIHYSRRLNDLPFEDAITLMKAEYNYVVKNFGYVPTSWCSLQNADNVALAAWAFDNLNMIWRNGSSGVHNLPNIGNLDNATWPWWSKSLGSRIIYPTFTHETDIEPAIPFSIDYSKFTEWVDNYKNMGYEIVGFAKWWKIINNSLYAKCDNIYADDRKMFFSAHTNGEKALVNVDNLYKKSKIKVIDITNNHEISWKNINNSVSFYVENNHSYNIMKEQ